MPRRKYIYLYLRSPVNLVVSAAYLPIDNRSIWFCCGAYMFIFNGWLLWKIRLLFWSMMRRSSVRSLRRFLLGWFPFMILCLPIVSPCQLFCYEGFDYYFYYCPPIVGPLVDFWIMTEWIWFPLPLFHYWAISSWFRRLSAFASDCFIPFINALMTS